MRRAPRAFGGLLAAGLAGALAGCAVGPRYVRPAAAAPQAYAEESPEGTRAWKPAEPADVERRGSWWDVFGDPDLDALEAQAAAANQTVVQAEARFRIARATARGARADLFPTVGAGVSATRSRTAINRSTAIPGAPAGIGNTYQVSGDFAYEIDVWGRVRRNLEANVASAQASAADLEAVRLSVHAELAVDYFALRGIDAERDLLVKSIADYEKALRLTRDRHAQGIVSGVDVAQAETQLETTRAQATELEVQRALLAHAIAVLAGKAPAELPVPPAPSRVEPPLLPILLPSELLERRPDVASAERNVAAANAQIGVAQAGFFPSLVINATGGWESGSWTKFFSAPNLFWSLGAALAQTLFEGGRRIAAKEQAVAGYDAAVAAYREGVLVAFQEVEDALSTLRLLAAESEQQARAVVAAERAAELAQNRYQGGITTYLEVVTAQAIALANERNAVDLQTRRMTASVGLVKALGGGWREGDLPAGSAILSRVVRPEPQPESERR
jgi:NodT family efflux transporter outer membrane factor (OMF) lipoprotein